MKRKDIINQILEHMKEYDFYNYQDAYENDEIAYKDIDRTLGINGWGIKEYVIEDIDSILRYEDVRNPYIKKHLEDSIKLGINVNEFVNDFLEKNKGDVEIN